MNSNYFSPLGRKYYTLVDSHPLNYYIGNLTNTYLIVYFFLQSAIYESSQIGTTLQCVRCQSALIVVLAKQAFLRCFFLPFLKYHKKKFQDYSWQFLHQKVASKWRRGPYLLPTSAKKTCLLPFQSHLIKISFYSGWKMMKQTVRYYPPHTDTDKV